MMSAAATLPSSFDLRAFLGGLFASSDASVGPVVRPMTIEQQALADSVLAARDLDSFEQLLDLAASNPAALRTPPGAAPRRNPVEIVLNPPKLDVTSLERVLGSTAAGICENGNDLYFRCMRALYDARGAAAFQPAPSAETSDDHSLYRIANRPGVSVVVQLLAMVVLHSLTAAMVIARAEVHGQRLEPWLAKALAQAFEAAPVSLWTIAGELMKSTASGDAEAASKPALSQKAAYEKDIDSWHARAVASEEPVFFPFGKPEDDY